MSKQIQVPPVIPIEHLAEQEEKFASVAPLPDLEKRAAAYREIAETLCTFAARRRGHVEAQRCSWCGEGFKREFQGHRVPFGVELFQEPGKEAVHLNSCSPPCHSALQRGIANGTLKLLSEGELRRLREEEERNDRIERAAKIQRDSEPAA